MSVQRHVISALVQNEPGVLARVAGMFASRGFNIDSLVVGRTENPEFSRMTIVVNGDDSVLDQVRKQLAKIVEVVKIVDYVGVDFVERDLMMVRVTAAAPGSRREIVELAEMFRANIVDVGHGELMVKITGTEAKLEAFVELLQPYGIIELARTGVIAMPRGEKTPGITPVNHTRRATTRGTVEENTTPTTIDPADLPPG